MPDQEARVARVAQGTEGVNTIAPVRRIPIIVLPGIMGTRLTDPATNALVWNPTGTPLPRFAARGQNAFAAATSRIGDVTAPLVPDDTHGCNNANSFNDFETQLLGGNIENFLNLIPDFYADLVLTLESQLRARLRPKGATPRVSCCGYDWRVSNDFAAARLATVVDGAMQAADGEKVILVAHSMGGLVARHFCANLGGEAKVAAVFLLGSPSLGAPASYGSLRNGIGLLEPLRFVLGFLSADSSRRFNRQIPTVYQLLPNQTYCQQVDKNWVRFLPNLTGFPPFGVGAQVPGLAFNDCSNEVLLYNDILTGLADDPDLRFLSGLHLTQALAFQSALIRGNSVYMHPKTFAVFTSNNSTPTKYAVTNAQLQSTLGVIQFTSTTRETKAVAGDATVPTTSALPSATTFPFVKTLQLSSVDHQHIPTDSNAIEFVVSSIVGLF